MIDINNDSSQFVESSQEYNSVSSYTKKIIINRYSEPSTHSYESKPYLESEEYLFIKKGGKSQDSSHTKIDTAWVDELKTSIIKTKKQINSRELNNKDINKRIVERMTKYTSIKKKLNEAINEYYSFHDENATIHTASIFNFLKYTPEINNFNGEKIVSIDSDMMLITLTLVKEDNRIDMIFDKTGEILFNLSDKNSQSLRISGSAYFPGGISNAYKVTKVLGMV